MQSVLITTMALPNYSQIYPLFYPTLYFPPLFPHQDQFVLHNYSGMSGLLLKHS